MSAPTRPEAPGAETWFRLIVEAAPNAMLMVDRDRTITLVNRGTEALFGYSRTELLGRELETLIPERFRANHPGHVQTFLRDPQARSMGAGRELFGRRKDGTEVPIEIGLNPIETPDGLFTLASIIDITERKRAEERFRLVVEAAPNAMILVDRARRITLINRSTEKLFGFVREELVGQPIENLVPERFRERHPGHVQGFFSDPKVRSMGAGRELFGRRKDGTEVPIEIGLNPIETPDGLFTLASIIDITERKRAEERFRLVVEAAPNAMLMADRKRTIVLVNRKAEDLFGYTREELIGRPIESLVPERFRGRHPGHVESFFADPKTRAMGAGRELFGRRKDGTEVPIEIGLNPIETPDGHFTLASIIDITQRKRADDERTSLLDQLQAATKDLEQRVEARTRDVRESEVRYRALFEDSPISLWEIDYADAMAYVQELQASTDDIGEYLRTHPEALVRAAGQVKILALNRRSVELFEADDPEQLAFAMTRTPSPEGLETLRRLLLAFLDGETSFHRETVRSTLKGRLKHISIQVQVVPGRDSPWSSVIASMEDLTQQKEAEEKIRGSFHQQEVLLKEIHHRVKNNLAVISSLFYLESTHAKDEHTARVFEDSQRRVRSMALVHETLYGSQDLAAIDFAEYVRALTGELAATYGARDGHIQLETDLDPVHLTIELAVPFGLILNELVTNAFKHAFPGGRTGTVRVEIRAPRPGLVVLTVADDGVGLPADLDLNAEHTLGFRLIRSLVWQIRGSLEWKRSPGAEARLTVGIEGDVHTREEHA